MFKEIRKHCHHSPCNDRRIYMAVTGPSAAPAEAPAAEPGTREALKKARQKTDFLVFQHESDMLKLLMAGSEYKSGQWRRLNEQFHGMFGKQGVEKSASERLLKRFQEELFSTLKLGGDRLAVPDGKLGPYTLYALALYYNQQRPKVRLPEGSPKLEALIEKDADEAFSHYRRFVFANEVRKKDFREAYRDIKASTSGFNPSAPETTLGQWALALWEAGYSDKKSQKIGFPRLYAVDPEKYPDAYGKMEAVMIQGDQPPLFVDKKGKLFVYDQESKTLREKAYSPADWEFPPEYLSADKKESASPAPARRPAPGIPQPEAPAPAPAPVPRPARPDLIADNAERIEWKEKDIAESYAIDQGDYIYRTKEGSWIDRNGYPLDLSKALPKITEAKTVAGYYQVRDTNDIMRYVHAETGRIFQSVPINRPETESV